MNTLGDRDDGDFDEVAEARAELSALSPDAWETIEEAIRAAVVQRPTEGPMAHLIDDVVDATSGSRTTAAYLIYLIGWTPGDDDGAGDPTTAFPEEVQARLLQLRDRHARRVKFFVWTHQEGPLDWANITLRLYWERDDDAADEARVLLNVHRNDGSVLSVVTPPDSVLNMVETIVRRFRRLRDMPLSPSDAKLLGALVQAFDERDPH